MEEISFRNDVLPLKNKLYRLALRITLDTAEAEDVVQETFVRVWNKREEMADLRSVEAFCLTVCRNLALDKAESKVSHHDSIEDVGGNISDTASTPFEVLANDERLQTVHRLFNQLPEGQRTVMQLRDIEGYSYKEIAAVLGWSEDQVKVTLFRARRQVRAAYEKIENYGL